MSHITTCPRCATCYEECSEEDANSPDRRCKECTLKRELLLERNGRMESFGVLVKKRTLEHLALQLTYDEARHLWWIVVGVDGRLLTLGYREERRETCWDLYVNGTVDQIIEACRPEASA